MPAIRSLSGFGLGLLFTMACAHAAPAPGTAAGSASTAHVNRIADGADFEAGLDGCALGMVAGRLHREAASVILEIDPSTAAHGGQSLRFVRPAACRLRYGLFFRPVAMRPGGPCTLSAWIKASRDGARGGMSLFAAGGDRGRPGMRPLTRVFPLTTEWARYELRIAELPPSAPVDGDPESGIYWAVLHPGDDGATVWIDAVQLEQGAQATPFSSAAWPELAVESNRPGNQFWAGEPITPRVRIYAPKARGPIVLRHRALDVIGDELAAGRQELTVPADGRLAIELPAFTPARRAWVTIEVVAGCDGSETRESVNVAVLERIDPPLPDQPCQLGFDYNGVTSPDNFGAGEHWHATNVGLNLDRIFRLAPQAGARWQRAADIVRWDDRPGFCVESAPGTFTFHDEGVKAIRAYGFEIMATLGNANAREAFCPPWARSDRTSRLAPIPTDEAWRRYIRTMVERYKGAIRHWEIINEPNTAFWAQDYLPLLAAASDEIRKTDPGAKIVGICGTADQGGDPQGYMRAVVEAGGLRHLDIVSGHTFCKPRPWMSRGEMPTWDYLVEVRSLLERHAPGRALPLWNTEGVKYPCWSGRPGAVRTTGEFVLQHKGRNVCASQGLAAAYVVRDCVIEFCGGARVLFLWQFRNELVDMHLPVAEALGTVDFFAPDGTPQAKFVALNALADKLRGARPIEHFGLSPQVRCTVFERAQGPFALLWRENEDESERAFASYLVPFGTGVTVEDMFGRPIDSKRQDGTQAVTISETPVYILAAQGMAAGALADEVRKCASRVAFGADKPLRNTMFGPGRFGRGKGKRGGDR